MDEPSVDFGTDDPKLARARRATLTKLSGGVAGSELAELAREILAGRFSAPELVTISTYSEAFAGRTDRFAEYYRSLSEDEREQLAEQGQALLEQPPATPAAVPRSPRADEPDDDPMPETFRIKGWD